MLNIVEYVLGKFNHTFPFKILYSSLTLKVLGDVNTDNINGNEKSIDIFLVLVLGFYSFLTITR